MMSSNIFATETVEVGGIAIAFEVGGIAIAVQRKTTMGGG